MRLGRAAVVLLTVALPVGASVAGCGGGPAEDGPLVRAVGRAVGAVESYSGGPRDYIEVTATPDVVSIIVSGPVEQFFWSPEDGLTDPVALDTIDRPTFDADAIGFDPDRIFDRLRSELPNSEIVDLAVTGDGAGGALYDARVRSSQGGTLLVLLAADGRVLGVQAE